eukprot:3684619-Amphidinium_carterae.1
MQESYTEFNKGTGSKADPKQQNTVETKTISPKLQAANSGSMPDRRVSAYQGSSAKSSFANLSSQAT